MDAQNGSQSSVDERNNGEILRKNMTISTRKEAEHSRETFDFIDGRPLPRLFYRQ